MQTSIRKEQGGIPKAGSTGEGLKKFSNADYDAGWGSVGGGGSVGTNGVATVAANLVGPQVIPHGLGSIPDKVRIIARWSNGGTPAAISDGTYINSLVSTACVYFTRNGTTATDTVNIAVISNVPGVTEQDATITVDAVNITLTWASNIGGLAGNIEIEWEAIPGGGSSDEKKVGVGNLSNINWYNFQYPFLAADWTFAAITNNFKFLITTGGPGTAILNGDLIALTSTGLMEFNMGKQIIVEGDVHYNNLVISVESGWGLWGNAGSAPWTQQGTNDPGVCFVADSAGNFFARTADGAGFTETAIPSLAPLSSTLRIEYDPIAVQARFYVNGVLVATNTTNLPTAVAQEVRFAIGNNGATGRLDMASAPSFAIEK